MASIAAEYKHPNNLEFLKFRANIHKRFSDFWLLVGNKESSQEELNEAYEILTAQKIGIKEKESSIIQETERLNEENKVLVAENVTLKNQLSDVREHNEVIDRQNKEVIRKLFELREIYGDFVHNRRILEGKLDDLENEHIVHLHNI